jgi:pimeloyl-ACP methyl ester carboxylesterase
VADVVTWRVRSIPGPPGRSFVLVHGVGASSRYFAPLARALGGAGSVHAVDLPGFGGTPRPARALTVGDHAEVVHGWLTRAAPAHPVLVGHSMGAQVVAELLARHPGAAASAVLVGPTVNPTEATAVRQGLRLAQSSLSERRGVLRVLAADYLRAGVPWYVATLRQMLEHRLEDVLPRVGADVLVVRGERDTVATSAWGRAATDLLPRGRLAVVPGGAHAVMVSHAEQVAALVVAHADRHG